MPVTPSGFVPHIIVGMEPNGDLFFETYVNGGRVKRHLTQGQELANIRAELLDQRDRETARQKSLRDKDAEQRAALHKRVFERTVQRHGLRFANAKIGNAPRSHDAIAKRQKSLQLEDLDL